VKIARVAAILASLPALLVLGWVFVLSLVLGPAWQFSRSGFLTGRVMVDRYLDWILEDP